MGPIAEYVSPAHPFDLFEHPLAPLLGYHLALTGHVDYPYRAGFKPTR